MVYLISTDSKVMLDKKINSLIKDGEEVISYNYLETSLDEIIDSASYGSLFDYHKNIIVKNADFFGSVKLNDKEKNKLVKYLDNPNPDVNIIFVTYNSIDKRKEIVKKVGENIIILTAPKGYDLINYTKLLINKYGFLMNDEEVKYLISASLNSWDLINNEVEKLSLLFQSNSKISMKDLQNIVCSNAKDNEFKFVDAVVNKDGGEAFDYLKDLLLLKVDPLKLFNLLTREYRLILMYQILYNKNYSRNDMIKELGVYDWQLDKIRKESNVYHIDDLKDIMISLNDFDYAIKSGQKEKTLALEEFIVNIMGL